MRRPPPTFLLTVVCGLALGCGASPAAVKAPAEEGLPLTSPPPRPPVVLAEDPVPEPPTPGDPVGPCPLQWTPRALGASVVSIPPEQSSRMMAPLFRALCACTRPGQSVIVNALFVPDRGEVTARTASRPDVHARASAGIDACLAAGLGAQRYTPFHLGSDSLCAPGTEKPAPEPGTPAPVWVPRSAGCAPEGAAASIAYPLHVDRRDELPHR